MNMFHLFINIKYSTHRPRQIFVHTNFNFRIDEDFEDFQDFETVKANLELQEETEEPEPITKLYFTNLCVSQIMDRLFSLGYYLTMSMSTRDQNEYRYGFQKVNRRFFPNEKRGIRREFDNIVYEHMLTHGDLSLHISEM